MSEGLDSMKFNSSTYILQRWKLIDEGYGWFADKFIHNEVKHRYPAHGITLIMVVILT